MAHDTPSADGELRPEEFAEAAEAPIDDAKARSPRDAAAVLAAAGLTGVAAPEADGGMGLDLRFALPIAEAAGRLQLRFPLVEQMLVARALAGSPAAGAIARGERIGTIAWQGSIDERLAGHARLLPDCDWVLVPHTDGAVLIEVAGLPIEHSAALDPDVPQCWLRLDEAAAARAIAAPVARLDADAWARLRDAAAILFAGFVTGAAQGALHRTAAHVATRVQFGRPLSSKQAVRHWMARMQLEVEVWSAATRRVLATDEYGAARDARPTLAGAVAAAAFVLEKAIHLHGGMGFTWELPLHQSLRDIRAIEAALDVAAMTQDIGRQFVAAA